jgi:hypothetical protein
MATAHGQGLGAITMGYIPTGAVTKYRCVEQVTDDNSCKQVDTAGDVVLGVCQESISAGDATNLRVSDIQLAGVTIVELGETVARKARVVSDNVGRVVNATAATAKQNQVGIVLQSGIVGDWVACLLTPGVQIDVA